MLAGFEQAGLVIARKQQVLALPVKAAYCVAAVTKAGLNLSICEYDTVEHAQAGLRLSEQAFKSVRRRTLHLNEKTMLTLILRSDAPEPLAQRAEAEKLFAAMVHGPGPR